MSKVLIIEKQEILEFDNLVSKTVMNESNSQLLGKVMKFDPKYVLMKEKFQVFTLKMF